MPQIQRKLAAILAADVYQFSAMMGEDESGTLASLRACRAIVDGIIGEHHGRIFGSAGDSVLAEFASAVSAVICAVECQRAMADRNSQPDTKPMQFRIGVNIGDVIIEADNLYGDGVNVAARLEAIARPGWICVSSKVYEEVRRKVADLRFIDGGVQSLKNIVDPVGVYHIGSDAAGVPAQPAAPTGAPAIPEKPAVAVGAIRIISGDDEVKALAEGLDDAIRSALAHNTAITVKSVDTGAVDFAFKGSVQAAGRRLRFSFALAETASAAQIWAQRYDRQLDDVFDLQDEIVQHVAAAIRNRIKLRIFEKLRSTDDAVLAVPQLLDKAAGIFMSSLDRGGQAVPALRLAVTRAPENSMAWAMLGFGLYRLAEYDARVIAPEIAGEILASVDRAIALDPKSYVARSFKAIAVRDLRGDMRAVRELADEALERNANFVPAKAMRCIADIHLGDVAGGIQRLEATIAAGTEDASHLRHRRELAIGYFLAGNTGDAARLASKLVEDAPEMKRNLLVLAGLLAAAGDQAAARRTIETLRAEAPELTVATAHLPRFGDVDADVRFRGLLRAAGL